MPNFKPLRSIIKIKKVSEGSRSPQYKNILNVKMAAVSRRHAPPCHAST